MTVDSVEVFLLNKLTNHDGISLVGGRGSGKTHLLTTLINKLAVGDTHMLVLSQNVQETLESIKKTASAPEEPLFPSVACINLLDSSILPKTIGKLCCDFIFIDNAEITNGKVLEEIAYLITAGECKKIIITSNTEPHRLISGVFHTLNWYTHNLSAIGHRY